MTPGKQPGGQTGGDTPAKPPARSIGDTTLNGLPMLTEVVAETDTHLPRVLNADEIQQLLPQLETHIEALFTRKLGAQLEQLQRLAIEQAISELKAELPELLRDTLNAYLDSR